MLSAPEFAQAPRLSQFLTYVAEESLAGRGAAIKGYTIATAVYGRPADFDPNADPLVRVEAGRLRKALSQYYQTAGASDPVQLDMPRGAYAVTFAARGMAVPETQAAALPPAAMPQTPSAAVRPPINPFYLVGSVAALATLGLLIWQIATAPALPPANPAPPPAASPRRPTGSTAPDYMAAWSALTFLYLDEYRYGFNPRPRGSPAPLELALEAALNAVRLSPEDARAWQSLYAAFFFRGDLAAFRDAGAQALRRSGSRRTIPTLSATTATGSRPHASGSKVWRSSSAPSR